MSDLDKLLLKYRAPAKLYARSWQSDEVRDVAVALALIVRNYAFFGYDGPAVDAATLLEQSEPLECLTADDLAVKKMRAVAHAVDQRYDEALRILDPLMLEYAEDKVICRLHSFCMENRPAQRKKRA